MRIPKALFVEPGENLWYGIAAVAVSFFVFAYSTRFGQAPILVYYAVWLPLLFLAPARYLRTPGLVWIGAFGALATISIFWSAAPATTLRAGIQYATHIACAVIAARSLDIRTLTLGGLAGVALVLAYSLAVGDYHYDPIDGAYSFVGAFSSKNQLGFFASLGIYFAFAWIVLPGGSRPVSAGVLALAALSAYCLYYSQSATSMITVVGAIAASLGARALLMFPPITRKVLFWIATALVVLGFMAAWKLGAFDAILGMFGKDTTLTGRTYLWSQGIAAAGENPIFGRGYQAYWVHGYAEAERLWAEFYITARTGFHFHNTYIETMVELGAVGLALLVGFLVSVLFAELRSLLRHDDDIAAQVLFGITVMLLVRSLVEVDVITPYVVGSFLLYFAAARPRPIPNETLEPEIQGWILAENGSTPR